MHLTHACEPEELLYRRWEALSGTLSRFSCLDGRSVTILSPGRRNDLAGPDFLDAVLLIDNALVVGPVEMHRREADWFAHGHHRDPAYLSVCLHVLATPPSEGHARLSIPTLLLTDDLVASEQVVDEANTDHDAHADLPLRLAEASWHRFLRRVGEHDDAIREGGRDGFRRHLLVRLFDALGYSANREPMRRMAEAFWENRSIERSRSELLTLGLDLSGLRDENRRRLERLTRVPAANPRTAAIPGLQWDYSVRPVSAPELRLLAGVMLVAPVTSGRLIRDAIKRVRRDDAVEGLRRLLGEAIANESLLGIGRRDEMIVNVMLPAIAATAVRLNDSSLIVAVCRVYRGYPSLGSNRVVRAVERRWNDGRAIVGAFFQQGAIELHQTLLVQSK